MSVKVGTKARLMLANLTKMNLASQVLDEVTIYFPDSEELVEGIEVFDMNEADEYVAFPDGTYGWGDKVVTVKDSVVTSITPKETGEGGGTPGDLEVEVVTAEDFNKLVGVVKALVSEFEKAIAATVDIPEIQELKSENAKLSADLASTKADLASVKAEFALMKQSSKGDFADPNPKPGEGGGESKQALSTKDVESFYKK